MLMSNCYLLLVLLFGIFGDEILDLFLPDGLPVLARILVGGEVGQNACSPKNKQMEERQSVVVVFAFSHLKNSFHEGIVYHNQNLFLL
jgi:hypothetical protein